MTDRDRWAEDQMADLIEAGTDPLDAQKIVAAALAAIPMGQDPATYVQPPMMGARDATVTDEDVADARADWYVRTEARYKRLLDAREKEG